MGAERKFESGKSTVGSGSTNRAHSDEPHLARFRPVSVSLPKSDLTLSARSDHV